jgi:hypothetical protein
MKYCGKVGSEKETRISHKYLIGWDEEVLIVAVIGQLQTGGRAEESADVKSTSSGAGHQDCCLAEESCLARRTLNL